MPSDRDPSDSAIAWFDLPSDGWAELDDQLRSLTGATRVVVFRAPAARAAGGGTDDATAQRSVVARERVLERLSSPDVIFVAVVSGDCDGDALALALGCDLRLATDDAVLSFSSAALFGVLGRLVAAVGQTRAFELCLTGRRMVAAEAASAGLVNLVVGGGQVVDAVDDLTAALLATPRELATELKRALLAASSGLMSAGALSAKISLSEELAAVVRLAGDDEVGRER